MHKSRILILAEHQPFPVTRGDQLIVYNRLLYLSRYYEVDLFIMSKKYYNSDGLSHLSQYCNAVFLNRCFRFTLPPLLHLLPYSFLDVIRDTSSYTKIHIFTSRPLFLIDSSNDLSKVVVELIDSFHYNFKTLSKRSSNIFMKFAYMLDSLLSYYYEDYITKNYSTSYVSQYDADLFPGRSFVFRNGVNINRSTESISHDGLSFCFSGNLSYKPNIEAVHYLVEVFDRLFFLYPNIKLNLIGSNESYLYSLYSTKPYISFTGYVDNIQDELAKNDVSLVPVFSGSGFQNKIIESIASGTNVFVSRFSLNGYPKDIHDFVFVVDDFYIAIENFLKGDFSLYSKDYLFEYASSYSWESINYDMFNCFYLS